MSQGRYTRAPEQEPHNSKRPHRRFYLILSGAAAAVALLTLCTCLLLAKTKIVPGVAVSSQQEASSAASEFSSDAGTSAQESSSEELLSSEPGESVDSAVLAAFEANPIDAALEQAVGTAGNNAQLLDAYETALNAWKNELTQEIIHLKRSLPDADSFAAEQTAWEQQTEQKFAASASDGEGSGAALQRLHAACDAYRERTRVIYARLLRYEPGYTISK